MIGGLTKEEKTENLEDKIRLLALLRGRVDFADIQKAYDNWRFSDLIGDNDFKRMYADQAVKERERPVSEYFEENIDKYIKLVEKGKEITSRYFGKWKVNFQAYCEEINNNRVLNVNLIHYDKSEPTRISDILQQEKDIKELNIYCNKKHEIYAHQEDKKRYYEFKEGAYYEMTSTWPVKDEFGNVSICTMIMNVSSDGITEVLKFNGKDFVPSKEILELIKQNDELYIQGLSLYDAVMKSLEKDKAADVVPINFHNESIVAYQDKEPEGKLKLECDADNSSPSSTKGIATQTEINSQQTETQTEVNLQHTETQTETNSQHIETQTGVTSQQIGELKSENQRLNKKLVEAKREIEELEKQLEKKEREFEEGIGKIREGITQLKENLEEKERELKNVHEEKRELRQELEVANAERKELKSELEKLKKELNHVREENSNLENELDQLKRSNKEMNGDQEQLSEQVLDLQKQLSYSESVTQSLSDKLKNAGEEKKKVNKELTEAEQRIKALEKRTSDLQDELKEKERGSKAEIDAMCKELMQLKESLKREEKELKNVHEEKRKLEEKLKIVNVEKKESEEKLKEFEKEIDQAAHIMKEKEQFISNLKRQMQELEDEYKAQQESYA